MEVSGLRIGHKFVEIHSRLLSQLSGYFQLNPCSGLELWRVALQKFLFSGIGAAHYVPRVARHIRFVYQDRAHCAFAGGFIVLVSPAPVISQGGSLKELWIVR